MPTTKKRLLIQKTLRYIELPLSFFSARTFKVVQRLLKTAESTQKIPNSQRCHFFIHFYNIFRIITWNQQRRGTKFEQSDEKQITRKVNANKRQMFYCGLEVQFELNTLEMAKKKALLSKIYEKEKEVENKKRKFSEMNDICESPSISTDNENFSQWSEQDFWVIGVHRKEKKGIPNWERRRLREFVFGGIFQTRQFWEILTIFFFWEILTKFVFWEILSIMNKKLKM